MPNSKATKLDEMAGNLELPDGRKIHARIGFFKVQAPVKVDGVEKEVTEYFAFGFEAEDTGYDDFDILEVSYHTLGSGAGRQVQKNLVEFKLEKSPCVVLTVKQ
jgi:hypothetical protein